MKHNSTETKKSKEKKWKGDKTKAKLKVFTPKETLSPNIKSYTRVNLEDQLSNFPLGGNLLINTYP